MCVVAVVFLFMIACVTQAVEAVSSKDSRQADRLTGMLPFNIDEPYTP